LIFRCESYHFNDCIDLWLFLIDNAAIQFSKLIRGGSLSTSTNNKSYNNNNFGEIVCEV